MKRGADRSSVTSDTLEEAKLGLVNIRFAASDVKKTLVALFRLGLYGPC